MNLFIVFDKLNKFSLFTIYLFIFDFLLFIYVVI